MDRPEPAFLLRDGAVYKPNEIKLFFKKIKLECVWLSAISHASCFP